MKEQMAVPFADRQEMGKGEELVAVEEEVLALVDDDVDVDVDVDDGVDVNVDDCGEADGGCGMVVKIGK